MKKRFVLRFIDSEIEEVRRERKESDDMVYWFHYFRIYGMIQSLNMDKRLSDDKYNEYLKRLHDTNKK